MESDKTERASKYLECISHEVKKEKVIDKLKGFGSDLLSNIIAGIITNPTILG